jgi:hypothetical protein
MLFNKKKKTEGKYLAALTDPLVALSDIVCVGVLAGAGGAETGSDVQAIPNGAGKAYVAAKRRATCVIEGVGV